MDTTSVLDGIRAFAGRVVGLALCGALVTAAGFTSLPATASAIDGAHCGLGYDSDVIYPSLSANDGPDLFGGVDVVLYADEAEAVIELDSCLYSVDRGLEFDGGALGFVTVWVEPRLGAEPATLFVTQDGVWVDTIEVADMGHPVTLWTDFEYGLEVAGPGQQRPIKPLVVLKPTSENPVP